MLLPFVEKSKRTRKGKIKRAQHSDDEKEPPISLRCGKKWYNGMFSGFVEWLAFRTMKLYAKFPNNL